MKRVSGLLALGALIVLGACSDGGAPSEPKVEQLNPQVNADLVAVAADGIGEEVDMMRAPGFDFRVGFFGSAGGPVLGPCNLAARTCTFTRDNLTITRTLTYYDASGKEMAAYDPEQTASVRIVSRIEGSVSRETDKGSWSAQVLHNRNMTVSGLQGDEQKRTWNGTGDFAMTRTVVREQGTRSYEIAGTLKVSEVVVPRNNNDAKDPWPLSGTIERSMTVKTTDQNGDPVTFTRKIVVTFNGTQFASATVTRRDGTTETFQIDLAARKGRRP
jgi:hypothetical protein